MTDALDPLLVIAGATATGKTQSALQLASVLGGELVGADSVQVYRGFDIGSAKPTEKELAGTPHHLIDIVDPSEEIDAADYANRADAAIEKVQQRGRLPIVVGGTGLWLRALIRGLVDVPPVDPALRGRLETEAEEQGASALHARLSDIDPRTAAAVHPNDLFRIIRALEVFEQTGTPLGELRAAHALGAPRYRAVFVVLEIARDRHAEIVDRRVAEMFAAGWVDEVQALRAQWGDEVRAFGSVGYREVLSHVRGDIPLEEAERLVRKSTKVYARRQRTWFRGEPDVTMRTTAGSLDTKANHDDLRRELRT